MLFGGIRLAVGRLLNDEEIEKALNAGGNDMQTGIMPRCIDYDRDYKLSRLGLGADQRAVGALYIFSKEVKSAPYVQLEKAVRNYAASKGLGSPFEKIDRHLSWVNGRMIWTH